jgi:hypothetical protein
MPGGGMAGNRGDGKMRNDIGPSDRRSILWPG